ncbi:MAG: AmmeMemoRadiSam system radical SAM enzyme [Candidatus Omnitrophica bacterium]|nr:AmmeMemoRadiSam system radical SAM enzyme [Candidatus Omnitrophota bacterium]MCM8831533.1 AmmeMemoRadiSam system radical SAM enzyme [Candidatus Omnitrophota bacterium]
MIIVQCQLCPKSCIIKEGERGDCRARVNLDGKLVTINYGYPCAIHIDPIEKKPLYHFYPGSPILSLACAGCNLHCKNCQNWEISQANPEDIPAFKLQPSDIVNLTLQENCDMIAYTYTDPFAFYEYTLDISILAKKYNLKNVLVTAGYLNQEPLKRLLEVTDALHIDLKFFDDAMYKKITTATLKPVLDTILLAKKMDVWFEIVHLVIPTLNDDFSLIKKMCIWIKENVGEDTPIHFSRFYPQYLLKNLPLTPIETLRTAVSVAKEVGLNYVYMGNVWGEGEDTYCPYDGKLLIKRIGYSIKEYNLEKGGRCKFCGGEIPGRWF